MNKEDLIQIARDAYAAGPECTRWERVVDAISTHFQRRIDELLAANNRDLEDRRRLARELRIQQLLVKAVAAFELLSPEEKKAHRQAQAESWVRGETGLRDEPGW